MGHQDKSHINNLLTKYKSASNVVTAILIFTEISCEWQSYLKLHNSKVITVKENLVLTFFFSNFTQKHVCSCTCAARGELLVVPRDFFFFFFFLPRLGCWLISWIGMQTVFGYFTLYAVTKMSFQS